MLRKQHSQAKPVNIDVGDSVMKRTPDRSCKLTPNFTGPYLVTARLYGDKFKILDPKNNISEVVNFDRLMVSASFVPDPVPPTPTTDLPPPDSHSSHNYWLRSAECQ